MVYHVPKDLAAPNLDCVEQEQGIVALDASENTAPVTTTQADVDQTPAIVPKDIAVQKTDGVQEEQSRLLHVQGRPLCQGL